ncbi:hypothetical protein EOL73_04015 [Candidatus Saccharibacteria bacterium]|nr:hypothetical protein [Candidatus Saccharibacteria bacterium]
MIKTIKVSGKDYAKVADRLKIFWEQNPNGKIDTERQEGEKIRFIARIWRDKETIIELAKAGTTPEVIKLTASATASADAAKKGDKENEKLETVAVGRALAMLGYLASGEVASREEMEEFNDYRNEKIAELEQEMEKVESMEELQNLFMSLTKDQKVKLSKTKDKAKARINETN